MPKSILVITYAGEVDNCSLKKAHAIAAPLETEVDVVQFIKSSHAEAPELKEVEQQAQQLSQSLDQLFADYEHRGSITSQIAVTNDIVGWVVNYCEEKEFDLIVKAGHRSETLFHTPCDWELIRNLQVPVLIASQQHWRNKHNVLAAINPNNHDNVHQELNSLILQWSKKWANTFNSTLHIVYSLPVSKILKELDVIDLDEYASKHRQEGEEKLTELLKQHDLTDVNIHITAGPPEKTISHCANELKAELVIMGSMGRRGLTGMLIGNVAEKAMHNLRTDSLVIERKK